MKTKIFVLLLALCLLFTVSSVASYAMEARDGAVGDDNGVVTDANTTTTVAVTTVQTTLPITTARPTAPSLTTVAPVTTAPVTTGMLEDGESGSVFAIVLAVLAAAAVVTLVVVLVPKIRR